MPNETGSCSKILQLKAATSEDQVDTVPTSIQVPENRFYPFFFVQEVFHYFVSNEE